MEIPTQHEVPNDGPNENRGSPESTSADDPLDSPIAGVSLALYVSISRSLADVGYDATRGPEFAALEGIDEADWWAAVAGWTARMHDDPAVAHRFNVLYTQP
ncbi:MAG: hypothetical protein ABJH68_10095 [Ilumatobacter sp.]|uniref:hypothetical protein n=1 Tax=Ilumatobacter sp. TaxID=1967498 RepID=UPI003297501F